MGKHKSDGKKKKKGSQLVIRLTKEERDAFVTLCDARDTSAARELRRFMREWVAENSPKSAETAEPVADPAALGAPAGTEPPEAASPTSDPAPSPAAPEPAEATLAEKPKAKRKQAAKLG